MMPTPVIIAYTLLILLPTIKLIAPLVSRRSWERLKELQADLEADERLSSRDREDVRTEVSGAYGHPLMILLPLVVPIAMPVVAFMVTIDDLKKDAQNRRQAVARHDIEKLRETSKPGYIRKSEILLNDAGFEALTMLAFPLGFLRYPGATLFLIFGLIMTAWIPITKLGMQYGSKLIIKSITKSIRTNTLVPIFLNRDAYAHQ